MPPTDFPRDRAVRTMFDRIAGRYDLLNRIISFRLDGFWRQKAIEAVFRRGARVILDLGSGTGDLSFAAAKRLAEDGRVVGIDVSSQMLRLAQAKRQRKRDGERVDFAQASALLPPFRDGAFDGVMTAFVLRNVSDLRLFFAQAFRVLKPGGTLVTLDMFPPPKGIFSRIYALYFYRFVPWLGGLLSNDPAAYHYLSHSVRQFAPPEAISVLIQESGFESMVLQKFLRGAVCLHVAQKPPVV